MAWPEYRLLAGPGDLGRGRGWWGPELRRGVGGLCQLPPFSAPLSAQAALPRAMLQLAGPTSLDASVEKQNIISSLQAQARTAAEVPDGNLPTSVLEAAFRRRKPLRS